MPNVINAVVSGTGNYRRETMQLSRSIRHSAALIRRPGNAGDGQTACILMSPMRRRPDLRQCGLFDRHMRMKIGLRGLNRFMPKPQGDDGTVNSRLEQHHCGSMT